MIIAHEDYTRVVQEGCHPIAYILYSQQDLTLLRVEEWESPLWDSRSNIFRLSFLSVVCVCVINLCTVLALSLKDPTMMNSIEA